MKRKDIRTLLFGLALLVTCPMYLGCNQPQTHSDSKPSGLPAAPSLDLVDQSGRRWTSKDLEQGETIVDFWSRTCGPCIASMPALADIYRQRGSDQFKMLSINTDGDKAEVERFLKKNPLPNPVLLDDGSVASSWDVTVLPTLFLVREGKVIGRWEGSDATRELVAALSN